MTDYRSYREFALKAGVISYYQKIESVPDRKIMSFTDFMYWIDTMYDSYAQSGKVRNPEHARIFGSAIKLRDNINTLVDMGALNFDEQSSLEEIVDLVRMQLNTKTRKF